jgi:Protein of unknown function (DUF1194)
MRAGSSFTVSVTTSGRSVRAAPKSPQTSSTTPRSHPTHRAPLAPRLSVFFRNSRHLKRPAAGSVAAAILAAPRSFMGRTSISAAIDLAMAHFAKSKWQAKRRVIDISGDGTNNSGRPVTEARDQAIAQGVTINGLAIINDQPSLGYSAHTQPPGGLPLYYRQNVIGGPNSFLLVVQDFNSFADAMANKLAKEIDVARDAAERQMSSVRRRLDGPSAVRLVELADRSRNVDARR